MPVVAVFDTNVLFSGLGWKGAPFQCLELARSGRVLGVTCREILDELADKLASKLGFTTQQVQDSLTDLLSFIRMAAIAGTLRVVADDPDDDKILECGVASGAAFIVTGDRRHLLPLGSYQGMQILSPRDFLAAIAASGSSGTSPP
jgi:putative PIN family toxin of toxin-antitoxin system